MLVLQRVYPPRPIYQQLDPKVLDTWTHFRGRDATNDSTAQAVFKAERIAKGKDVLTFSDEDNLQ